MRGACPTGPATAQPDRRPDHPGQDQIPLEGILAPLYFNLRTVGLTFLMAVAVLVALSVLIVSMFFQPQFIQGVMSGP